MSIDLKRCTICIALLLVVAGAVSAQTTGSEKFRIRYQRLDALGGQHPAFVDDLAVVQTNPGGLFEAPTGYQFTTLNTTVTGPMLSFISLLTSGEDAEEALESDEVQELLRGVTARASVTGPVGFGYTGNGIGFSVHNTSDVSLTSPTTGRLELGLSERLLLNGGYAFRFPLPRMRGSALDLGFGIGTFVEGRLSDTFPIIELFDVVDDLDAGFAGELPFALESGFSFHVGMLFHHRDRLGIGVTVDNVYAPILRNEYESFDAYLDAEPAVARTTDTLPPEVNLGVRHRLRLGRLANLIDQVDVYAAYFDALDFLTRDNPRNPLLQFAVGTEVQVLDILSIRTGLSEGLLAAGAGVQLGVVHVDGAIYGRELSSEPGLNSVYNVGFSMSVRR